MSKTSARFLIYGPEKLKFSTRIWVEAEVRNILERAKNDFSSVFLYSSLDAGISLSTARIAQELQIPVVGCIPYEGFNSRCLPSDKVLFLKIRRSLYSLKISGKIPNYILYRKRLLYLIHQTNKLIFVWDEINTQGSSFYGAISSRWKGSGKDVYHINDDLKTVNSFQL